MNLDETVECMVYAMIFSQRSKLTMQCALYLGVVINQDKRVAFPGGL